MTNYSNTFNGNDKNKDFPPLPNKIASRHKFENGNLTVFLEIPGNKKEDVSVKYNGAYIFIISIANRGIFSLDLYEFSDAPDLLDLSAVSCKVEHGILYIVIGAKKGQFTNIEVK